MKTRRLLLPALLSLLPWVSCGGGEKPSGPGRTPSTAGSEGPATEAPSRLLPGNAGAVDFLMPLVSPARICALPSGSNDYSQVGEEPDRWAATPRYSGFTAETLLAQRPDLLIAHGWQSAETIQLVRSAGVQVLVLPLPETWEDILAAVRSCGAAVGAEQRAEEVVQSLEARARLLLDRAEAQPISALSYVNLGAGGWAAGAGTTADVLFGLAGFENAASKNGLREHATIDIERLFAIDPDIIVVGAQPGPDGSTEIPPTEAWLRGRSELQTLGALERNAILRLAPRLFTTSSPEILKGAEALREAYDAYLRGETTGGADDEAPQR